jgi:hypothetical protein
MNGEIRAAASDGDGLTPLVAEAGLNVVMGLKASVSNLSDNRWCHWRLMGRYDRYTSVEDTNQGMAGVRLDDGELISNTSISDLVLKGVGRIIPLF